MSNFEPLAAGPAPADHDHLYVVRNGELLLTDDQRVPTHGELDGHDPADLHLLGRDGEGRHHWARAHSDGEPLPGEASFVGLRGLYTGLGESAWNIAGRATQVIDWHATNRFCGRCSAPMDRSPTERAMRCPNDGHTVYPRLSPAIIVGVERDGQLLLGRSGAWQVPMYSVLAGFVEPGESLEETVIREVREEVGIEVTNPRYISSQPWPFPNSLMLGFTADWAGGEIEVDGEEIVDAQWFTPSTFPEIMPPRPSIAATLIEDYIERVTPQT